MRVPATGRLHGRRNTFLHDGAGKIRMPCKEQCDRHREVHPERPSSRIEQPIQHPILRAPQGAPNEVDGGVGRSGDERLDFILQRLDALEKRSGPGHVAKPMFRLCSPFSERILRAPLPNSFQMPLIPRYDGTADPHQHFNRYQTLMNVVTFLEEVLCRSFPATLDGLASEWFNELLEGKIDSWEDLAQRFLVHFAGNKTKLHFSHLVSVRQRPDEPLREFLARWKLETTRVYEADDKTSAILDFAKHQGLVEYDPRFPPICTVGEGPYCRFHKEAGHDTNACKVLKREIENLIQAGYLRQFVKKKNTWRKDDGKKNVDNRGKKAAGTQQKKRKEIGLPSDVEEETNPRQKRVEEIRMIYGGNTRGDSAEQRKKWVYSAYVGDVCSAPGPSKVTKTMTLLFGPKDLPKIPSPHRDAIVVMLKKELLKRVRTPLSGFTGDIIDSERLIEVMVTFGDGEHKKTIPVEFMVVLVKPVKGEKLYLYLGVSPGAISSVLLRGEGDTQRPIYYVSKTLRDAELRYSVVEKTIMAVVNTVKNLNHYFQAHEVEVRSHQPLSIIIRNPTASNRVIKWSVYLSQYQIEMKPRTAIKALALADFMVECTARDNNPTPTAEQGEWWTLSTDGSSAAKACGGSVVIQSPEGFHSYHTIKFQFKVSKNEAEYEALLSGMRIILNLKAEYVRIRAENTEADVLSKLSNDSPEHISKMAHVEDLGSLSIHVQLIFVITEETSGWITELIRYKKDGILPSDGTTARLIKRRAPTYVIENGRLYKRSYNGRLLRCIDEARAG
ncbi:unnamed protein product [Cuscuta campestris]|uniref:RNase H type-1 domain-containing protein n=1 Tax=Cuscuta campestris TaxID=132261 RepID=A0A484ME08_9ASTE|nr:unnamed protein product [Cuscuta campestris]